MTRSWTDRPVGWHEGDPLPPGATPLSAAELNRLEAGRFLGSYASLASGTEVKAHDLVTNPSGALVSRIADGTISGSYNPANWTALSAGSGVPDGGTLDQVLTKLSGADGDAAWEDIPVSTVENGNTVAAAGSAQTLPDVDVATIHFLTLTAAFCVVTPPPAAPFKSFTLVLKQDATGSRTVAWPLSIAWPGGVSPVLTSTPGGFDVFSFLSVDGATWLGFVRSQATVPVSDPSTIAGLQSWWKADVLALNDGDKVASWPDSSGHARTVVQATPALQPVFKTGIQNGRPVLRMAGATEFLEYDGTTGMTGKASYSIFYAYASRRTVAGANEILYEAGHSGGDHAIVAGLRNINPGGTDDFTVSQYADDGDVNIPNSTAFNVISAVKTAAAGFQLWRNGAAMGSSALPSGTFSPTFERIRLFLADFGGGVGVIGDVGEILVYDSALSTANRQKVEAYLRAKWATA